MWSERVTRESTDETPNEKTAARIGKARKGGLSQDRPGDHSRQRPDMSGRVPTHPVIRGQLPKAVSGVSAGRQPLRHSRFELHFRTARAPGHTPRAPVAPKPSNCSSNDSRQADQGAANQHHRCFIPQPGRRQRNRWDCNGRSYGSVSGPGRRGADCRGRRREYHNY